jgi:transposase
MDSHEDHTQLIQSMITQMETMWDKVHMDVSTRKRRLGIAFPHQNRLVKDIIETEKQMVQDVGMQINKLSTDLDALQHMFGLPLFDQSEYPSGSISLVQCILFLSMLIFHFSAQSSQC